MITYDELINGDDAFVKRIERAYRQKHGHPPNITDQAHNIWRLLREGWTIDAVLSDILGDVPGPTPVPAPPSTVDLTTWPRRGASIAAVIVDPKWDIDKWASILGERFANRGLTRVNIFSNDWGGPQIWPFLRASDGRFDLDVYNPEFVARTNQVIDAMHKYGIVVQLTLLELYSWSHRKSSAPNKDKTPFNYNVNGVRWLSTNTEEDDRILTSLPDAKLTAFLRWFVPQVDRVGVIWEIGNEFPEKGLHARMAALLRSINPRIQISVNRNEDSPGQYLNMGIHKGSYHRIAFHGSRLKSPADLDRVYEQETDAGRPDTFRRMLNDPRTDKARVIFSSDGARTHTYNPDGSIKTHKDSPDNPYDWAQLGTFAGAVLKMGASFEHQSRLKMPGNEYDFSKTEFDFLDQLAR